MLSVSKSPRIQFTRTLAALAFACILSSTALAADPTSVPSANPKSPGMVKPDILSQELIQAAVAQGSMPVENPSTLVGFYGYNNDGPMMPAPGDLPSASHKVEASKTELVFRGEGLDRRWHQRLRYLSQQRKDLAAAG